MKRSNRKSSIKVSPKITDPMWAEYGRTRDEGLRNRLAGIYLPIVKIAATKLAQRLPSEVDEGDLVQWGSLGLIQAIESFDPGRGFVFYTLAHRRIIGAMLDGLRQYAARSRRVIGYAKSLAETANILQVELGRPPAPEEMARQMRVDIEQFAKMERQQSTYSLSLSCTLDDDRGFCSASMLADTRAESPLARAEQNEAVDSIIQFLLNHHGLTEALIVRLHYLESHNMKEVGRALQVSESRISQLHKRVLNCVRAKFTRAA